MSEGKLYAVKNDKGQVYSFQDGDGFWWPLQKLRSGSPFVTPDEMAAKVTATRNGGHVVTLIEEPEKVVLTKEQAEIVEGARDATYPASYISNYTNSHDCEENLLINAYVNGYTVAKEKKYLLYKALGGKQKQEQFAQAYRSSIYPGTVSWILANEVTNRSFAQFTESEIEHYGLQDCEKVWCDSDD